MKSNNAIVRVNGEKGTSRTDIYESWAKNHLSIARSLIFGDTINGKKTTQIISDRVGDYFPNPFLAEQVMSSLFLRIKNSGTSLFPFPFSGDYSGQWGRKCILATSNAYKASAQIETQRAKEILMSVLENDTRYAHRKVDFIQNGELGARAALNLVKKRHEENKSQKETSLEYSWSFPFVRKAEKELPQDPMEAIASLQYMAIIPFAEKLLDRARGYGLKAKQLEHSLAKMEDRK